MFDGDSQINKVAVVMVSDSSSSNISSGGNSSGSSSSSSNAYKCGGDNQMKFILTGTYETV